MVEKLTIEFHGDLAKFLIIYDSIRGVVCLTDHNVSVQLRAEA